MAVIVALEAIKKEGIPITIYTDSKYVADAVEKGWIWNWEKKNFKNKKNPDLWMRFIPLYLKFKPKFSWIRGHSGHPENERCDYLAVAAANSANLLHDEWYENNGDPLTP